MLRKLEPALRLIVDEAAPGAWNMAVDEALLRLGSQPTLRLYAWSPHTVSLGYFQRAEDFADLPAGTPIVRRLTGGGAIHHGDELTFSLTLNTHLLPGDVAASYRLLHDAAIAALAATGVQSQRLSAGASPGARPIDRWCFAEAGRDDVVTARGKLLGSAQRRIRTPQPRLLHHGSLVLQRPALTPFTAAVADVADVTTDDAAFLGKLQYQLAQHIAGVLELVLQDGELDAAERTLAARLCAERYSDAAFVQQR
ncbi:MAG: hypothetical protein ABIP94_22930 [Planctomycetota bacterium]